MHRDTTQPRLAALAFLGIALALFPACRNRGLRTEPRTAPTVSAIDARNDAVLGRTLILPVQLSGAINPARPIAAKLDDGRKVAVSLHWIGVAPESIAPSRVGVLTSWMPEAGRWSATPASASTRPAGGGVWAVKVDLPLDAIGEGLWLGRQRIALNWLPSPDLTKAKPGPWASPLGKLAESPILLQLAEVERKSPARRWRHRLITRGLEPQPNPVLTPGVEVIPQGDEFADPVLEALAMQIESKWQVAIATLWLADPGIAERVKQRLAAAADFGDGNIIPVWPTDQSELDSLLSDLLNTRINPRQQVERATAWLDTQPPGIAWIIDDAGQRDAMTGQTVATCGITNLSDIDTLGWTVAGKVPSAPELSRISSWSGSTLIATRPPTDEEPQKGPPSPTQVEIHLGKWATVRPAALDRMLVRPPGLRIEPMRFDWDLAGWLAGITPRTSEDSWSAAGLLYRDEVDDGWALFIECRSPAIGEEETLRIWLGGFGAPSSVIKVGSGGSVIDELAPRQGLPSAVHGTVSRQGDKWSARIPIPARCIESDGTIRIGLERTDALSRRTAWPRPMVPWQTEPGRVAVDTTGWSRMVGGK